MALIFFGGSTGDRDSQCKHYLLIQEEEIMKNEQLSLYMKRCMKDYEQFMGISSLPEFGLISKNSSLTAANASGWGTWATHRFDFQTSSYSIEVWEDLWKPQLHGDYVIFHELTHLLDTKNLVKGDKKRNVEMRGFLEYHASQVETIKILNNNKMNKCIPFSMSQNVDTVASTKSVQEFVDEPANIANSLLGRSDFPKDIETFATTIGLIFNYYGRRSICLMYAEDFKEDIEKDKFASFIGKEQFVALDAFLRGYLNSNQIEALGQFYFKMLEVKMKEYRL